MTMPSKGRRNITVEGVLYHYKVSSLHYTVQNTETNKTLTVNKDIDESITPKIIEESIRAANM